MTTPTLQDLFTRSVKGLIKQGTAALSQNGDCRYLAPDGTRCAVGQLIDDEHYSSALEDVNFTRTNRVGEAVEASIGRPLDEHDAELLWGLQEAHDSWRSDKPAPFLEHFVPRAEEIATRFNLEMPK